MAAAVEYGLTSYTPSALRRTVSGCIIFGIYYQQMLFLER